MTETKTSAEWQAQFPAPQVRDPDGWDRRNWEFSWHQELITQEEYERRVSASTCDHRHMWLK